MGYFISPFFVKKKKKESFRLQPQLAYFGDKYQTTLKSRLKKMHIKSNFYYLGGESGRQDREVFKANPFINIVVDSHKGTVKAT